MSDVVRPNLATGAVLAGGQDLKVRRQPLFQLLYVAYNADHALLVVEFFEGAHRKTEGVCHVCFDSSTDKSPYTLEANWTEMSCSLRYCELYEAIVVQPSDSSSGNGFLQDRTVLPMPHKGASTCYVAGSTWLVRR